MAKPKTLVMIGGCGHLGLPLGVVFANCGINVVLLDISAERIAAVNSGRIPFMEQSADEHLKAFVGKTLDGIRILPEIISAFEREALQRAIPNQFIGSPRVTAWTSIESVRQSRDGTRE
jgi:UDP-N-acetyl-D-mannosaminuronic acid dehydrogenase